MGWLGEHKVDGAIVLPGSAFVELALAAAAETTADGALEIEHLEILSPVVFEPGAASVLRFDLRNADGTFEIRCRRRLAAESSLVARGRILERTRQSSASAHAWDDSAQPGERLGSIGAHDHQRLAAALGLEYGPAFQRGLSHIVTREDGMQAVLCEAAMLHEGDARYRLHPALLDCCLQGIIDYFRDDIRQGETILRLPVKFGRIRLLEAAPPAKFRLRVTSRTVRELVADFELWSAQGRLVAVLEACRFRVDAMHAGSRRQPASWRTRAVEKPLARGDARPRHDVASAALGRAHRALLAAEVSLRRGEHHRTLLPLLRAYAVSTVHEAFARFFAMHATRAHALVDAPQGVPESARAYFIRLARLLREEALLVREGDAWRLEPCDLPPAESIWRTLLRDHPTMGANLARAAHARERLLAWLEGGACDELPTTDGLDRAGDGASCDGPWHEGMRVALGEVIAEAAQAWTSDAPIRILELAGAAETAFLPGLDASLRTRLECHVAVPAGNGGVETHGPSLEANLAWAAFDPITFELDRCGDSPPQFDVVIATYPLHRAARPVSALAALHERVAPRGLLAAVEDFPDVYLDLVHGACREWWASCDAQEARSAQRDPAVWRSALGGAGFEAVEILVEPASEGAAQGSYLLLAARGVEEREPIAVAAAPGRATWLILAAEGAAEASAARLRRDLRTLGQHVVQGAPASACGAAVAADPLADRAAVDELLTVAAATGALDHVVLIASDEAAAGDPEVPARAAHALGGLLRLVQALGELPRPPRLWLVTRGGALLDDPLDAQECVASAGPESTLEVCDPAHGALWGFARVVMNEMPALACTLIDLPAGAACADAQTAALVDELVRPDGEREVVLRANARWVLRTAAAIGRDATAASRARARLEVAPGDPRNVAWKSLPVADPAAGEVEVAVKASGLNFRDVMLAAGLLPDEAVEGGHAGVSLGLEFAGIVTRVGAGVRGVRPGAAVIGFARHCFASHVVAPAASLFAKPPAWSFEQAAALPVAFLTAHFALHFLARLAPGERVLIHGAAGGVGIAAMQLALAAGADVYATAGSGEKRAFVSLLGARRVFDSRTLDFAEQVRAATGGLGVDVVLNSLTGEAMRRSLGVLRPFGRFLELGKRDFQDNTAVGLRAFRNNIRYFAVDVDQLLGERPRLARRLMGDVMRRLRDAALFPLPYRAYPAKRVAEALRSMRHGRHIGKLVVTMEPAPLPESFTAPRLQLRRDAAWLVVGGLSGFGLRSAQWLAERGAGHLILLGRRGPDTPGAEEAVEELRAAGATVTVVAGDAADADTVRSLVQGIRRDGRPLQGIVHAAMVLADAPIAELDELRLRAVLGPKLQAAWNLHRLTRDLDVEYFVIYSSVTTLLGNPGQANYAAANAALEGLCRLRRSLRLPAHCIRWGPISDTGYLARNAELRHRMEAHLGAAAATAAQALSRLDAILASRSAQTTVFDVNWTVVARRMPAAALPRFAELVDRRAPVNEGATGDSLASLRQMAPDEARARVLAVVTQELAHVLLMDAARIDPVRSLQELGVDSLMAVELALAVERRVGVRLHGMAIAERPTVAGLAAHLVEQLSAASTAPLEGAEGSARELSLLAARHGLDVTPEEVARVSDRLHDAVRSA